MINRLGHAEVGETEAVDIFEYVKPYLETSAKGNSCAESPLEFESCPGNNRGATA